MNSSTLEKMKAMKFAGMQRAFQASMETRQNEKLTADEFISYLIDQEWEYRQNRKITASLHRARFRYPARRQAWQKVYYYHLSDSCSLLV